MKKYSVTLYYHTNIVTEVSANSEKEAIEQARQMAARDDKEIIDILLGGMYEDGQPDCEEVEDDINAKMRKMHDEFVGENGRMPTFAYVRIKNTDTGVTFNDFIKLQFFEPCNTDNDIDDNNVYFYAEGINGLCNINTEQKDEFTIEDIYGFYDTYTGRPYLFINKYNDFCNNHGIFHSCVLNGELYLFTDERIKDEELPAGWYRADVRHSDSDFDQWATIEPLVRVNHAATIISDKPFNFGSEKYIVITDCVRTYDEEVA